jgi:hypothetical protein
MGTTEDRLQRVLAPFEGAENCKENRDKMQKLILMELPHLPEEILLTAIAGILGDG